MMHLALQHAITHAGHLLAEPVPPDLKAMVDRAVLVTRIVAGTLLILVVAGWGFVGLTGGPNGAISAKKGVVNALIWFTVIAGATIVVAIITFITGG